MKKVFVVFTILAAGMSLAGVAHAANVITIPNPLCLNTADPGCINNFTDLITAISDYILTLVGAVAVLVFIWAGATYMTAGGNPSKIQKANHIVIWAVIGAAIALSGKGLILVVKDVIGAPPS